MCASMWRNSLRRDSCAEHKFRLYPPYSFFVRMHASVIDADLLSSLRIINKRRIASRELIIKIAVACTVYHNVLCTCFSMQKRKVKGGDKNIWTVERQ